MKSWYRCLCILFIFILYFRFTTAYPSSSIQEQRSFLLCHLSPVSCKRSLSDTDETENLLKTNINDKLQMCFGLNRPFWFCFDKLLLYGLQHKKNQ
ncbi:unnamed protein product [Rotaria sordida]|uniref:Uncharacterized protein n=1 Tax=Rotaria sordida TaxID=392033 RepID=A0A814U2L5_9BILA|nr:unnamed protein product [Rotaria sordida]